MNNFPSTKKGNSENVQKMFNKEHLSLGISPKSVESDASVSNNDPESFSTDSESIKVKITKKIKKPTQNERDEHIVTHLAYANWCKHCINGSGVKDRAERRPIKQIGPYYPHVIQLDYAFVGNQTFLVAIDTKNII